MRGCVNLAVLVFCYSFEWELNRKAIYFFRRDIVFRPPHCYNVVKSIAHRHSLLLNTEDKGCRDHHATLILTDSKFQSNLHN
jgi:hypothetical protein